MPVTITLLINSGLRNPSWTLTRDQIARLRAVFTQHNRAAAPAAELPSPFGYSGFIVDSRDEPDLPRWFWVRTGVILVGSFSRASGHLIDLDGRLERFLKTVVDALWRDAIERWEGYRRRRTAKRARARATADPKCTSAPVLKDSQWSDAVLRTDNNCYNYATNVLNGTQAVPGFGSNQACPSKTPNGYAQGAKDDGLVAIASRSWPARCRRGGHFAFLWVQSQPPNDFHWTRLDRNGKWTHKFGPFRPSRVDEAGETMTTMSDVDMGDYDVAGGHFHVPSGVAVDAPANGC